MTTTEKNLLRAADQFLAQNGYRYDGRPMGEVKGSQAHFERRTIKTPALGQPRRRS